MRFESVSHMRTVYIHGALGRKYGREFNLDVATAGEAIRALCTQIKGFRNDFARGKYRIVWRMPKRVHLTIDAVRLHLGQGSLHIIPILAGSASSKQVGLFMVLAGAALIATAFVLAPAIEIGFVGTIAGSANLSAVATTLGGLGTITYGNIAVLGFGLLLAGASAMLAPKNSDPNASASGRGLFTQPENVSAQGMAVPLIYGKWLASPIVISTSLSNVNIPVGSV